MSDEADVSRDGNPTVSIVVVTRNRRNDLARLLEHLARLNPQPLEIIIVENDGRRQCEDLVAEHAERLPVRYAVEPVAGVARARNCGLELARGEIIAFTDDDCEPVPTWLAELSAPFVGNPHLGVVGGRTSTRLREGTLVEKFCLLDSSLSPFSAAKP